MQRLSLAGALGVPAMAVVCGYLVTTPRGLIAVAVLAGVGAFAVVAAVNRGIALALVLVAVLNGLPFVDFASLSTPSVFKATDALVVLLLAMLVVWGVSDGFVMTRAVRLASWWAVAFAGWWLVTLVRSSFFESIPVAQAVLFGRDFLYFALLVPAFAAVKWRRRELVGLVYTLGVAAVFFAIAATLTAVAGLDLGVITHPSTTGITEGVRRIYSPMNDLIVVMLAFGLGLAMVGPDRRSKRIGTALLVVMGLALMVQLTRALYVSTIVAFVVTTGLWLYQRDALAARLRRTTLAIMMTVALLATSLVYLGPSALGGGTVGAVVTRASSGVKEVRSSTGDFAYRVDLANRMSHVIGSQWPVGLGFLHPDYHYVPDLPDGSIRNSDVGVSNIIMTMGALGALLLYLPLLFTVVAVKRARDRVTGIYRAVVFGVMACVLVDLIDSPTLATLFNSSGLVLVALVLAIGVRASGGSLPGQASRRERPAVS